MLGSEVVDAATQDGGYSPGAAVRVRLASGRRAFVKALSDEIHAPSVVAYRREAGSMAHLPADAPVPRLLGVHDDGNWVALVYEDVPGRHPDVPWSPGELDRVAAAITDLSHALDPSPWPEAPLFAEVNAGVLLAWRDLAASPPPDLGPEIRLMIERLDAEGVRLEEVVPGNTLMHNDIRSDNILLAEDGRVVFIDWGMPCKGAIWQDLMMFALTAVAEGADVDDLVRRHPLTRDVAPSSIDVVVAAGYAAWRLLAARSEQPIMAHIHAYHVACAEASLRWLRRRAALRPS
jgi:aminoglycoside phosphotransferase (APT) family kinase protein